MTFNTTKSDTHKLVEVNVCVASLYQENLLHSYGKQDYLQYIYTQAADLCSCFKHFNNFFIKHPDLDAALMELHRSV